MADILCDCCTCPVSTFDFIKKFYLYMCICIYESKKIRNDNKELLLTDERKNILFEITRFDRKGEGEGQRGMGSRSLLSIKEGQGRVKFIITINIKVVIVQR